MARRSKEGLRGRGRTTKVVLALGLTAGLLAGCGRMSDCPPQEGDIQMNRPVGELTPTNPTTSVSLPPAEGPGYTAGDPLYCEGAFWDSEANTLTLFPLAEWQPYFAGVMPRDVRIRPNGDSRIDPAQPRSPGDFGWLNAQGDNLEGASPICEEASDFRVVKIHPTGTPPENREAVLAKSYIEPGQDVNLADPAALICLGGGVLHREFDVSTQAELDRVVNSMRGVNQKAC